MDTHLDLFCQALDDDQGNSGLLKFLIDVFADLIVLFNIVGILASSGEPKAAPVLGVSSSQS